MFPPGLNVSSGGVASNTNVESGGVLNVDLGGSSISATVVHRRWQRQHRECVQRRCGERHCGFGGGTEIVSAGGTDLGGTVLGSGGQEDILSGGVLSGPATMGESTILALDSNAVISGGVVLTGTNQLGASHVLQIDGTAIPVGLVISGFNVGDAIELQNIAFDSSGTASATVDGSGLDVNENGTDYSINFGSSMSEFTFGLQTTLRG